MRNLIARAAFPAGILFIGLDAFAAGSSLLHFHLLKGGLELLAGFADFEMLRRVARKKGYI